MVHEVHHLYRASCLSPVDNLPEVAPLNVSDNEDDNAEEAGGGGGLTQQNTPSSASPKYIWAIICYSNMTYGKRRTRMSPMFPPAILTPTWLTSYIKRGKAPCFFVGFPLLQYIHIYIYYRNTYIYPYYFLLYVYTHIKCIHIGTYVSCIISAHLNIGVYLYYPCKILSQCHLRVVSLEYPPAFSQVIPLSWGKN